MSDFTVTVEVGMSEQSIPYPYVVEQGDELAGTGVTAAALARVFEHRPVGRHRRHCRRSL